VDEFFSQATELAEAGNSVAQRKKKLKLYENRRKTQATDGAVNGLNNW